MKNRSCFIDEKDRARRESVESFLPDRRISTKRRMNVSKGRQTKNDISIQHEVVRAWI